MTLNFSPAPARISPEVLAAQAKPQPENLSERIQAIEARLREILYPEISSLLLFSTTAAGLVETVLNSFAQGNGLICVNGIFSSQWYQTAKALNLEMDLFDASFGKRLDKAQLEKALGAVSYETIILTEIEPFSGVLNDIPAFSEVIRSTNPDALIIADCSASVTSVPPLDLKLHADIIVLNSDQSFGLPSGLGMVLLGERAHFKSIGSAGVGWSLNFSRQHNWQSDGNPFSAAPFPLLYALDRQLDNIFLEGIENRIQRIAELGQTLRNWTKTSRFQWINNIENAAPTVTILKPPAQFTPENVADFLEPYAVRIGTIPDEIRPETIAIAHMNHTSPDEMDALIHLLDRFQSDYDTRTSVGINQRPLS